MTLLSPRIPHLFPPRVLARLLAPTYAAELDVDEEEAHERLVQALGGAGLADALHRGISAALEEKRGPRTSVDRLLDKVSAAVAERGGRLRAAPPGPGISAVLVRVNLELGRAPEGMRDTLASPRGAAALEEGVRAFGRHVVKELAR